MKNKEKEKMSLKTPESSFPARGSAQVKADV